jgi:D-serine deaminase-like pyridoxal phosphate-dependent protein
VRPLAAVALPDDLDTPAPVVLLDRLEANLTRMAALVGAAGVRLRPHAKTHKCSAIARRQLALGAAGITVATLAEAESFAANGCDDVFIAYPLWAGGARGRRVRALHERARLRVGVDGVEAATALAAAVSGATHPLTVLIEVDCGQHRSGVAPDQVAALATDCLRLGLDVAGAFTHPGHAYGDPDRVRAAAEDELAALTKAGEALEPLLGRPPELSGGSTPTVLAGPADPLTEVRPGTYVFGDRQQMILAGVPGTEIALAVAARVVSATRQGQAVVDAGSKALSSDRPDWLVGYGWLPDHPAATVAALTEEHAVVQGLTPGPRVGELVAVVPNHVCSAVNLAEELVVVADGTVTDVWPVDARRRHPSGTFSGSSPRS